MSKPIDPRAHKLQAIWRKTHRDFKGNLDGVRCVLVLRSAGTCLVPLDSLTDAEIESKLPASYVAA